MRLTHSYLVIWLVCSANAFNLDVGTPIIYPDAHRSNSIIVDYSYFGYSLILYPGNDQTEPWIQIGAPRGQIPNMPGNQTGSVFRCRIKRRCELVTIDENLSVPGFTEKKDGAWIGSTMDIDVAGNRTVVCGFRLQTERNRNYFMQGGCYWSTLTSDDFHLLAPMTNTSTVSIKQNGYLVYYTALAQVGFSAHLTSSNGISSLLLGAPGVVAWRGTVVVYEDLDVETTHNVVKAENIATIFDASYYGYDVTSGYFFNKTQRHYVMSSTRANIYLGEIIVYDFAEGYNQPMIVRDRREGSQMGENFGASLTAGDLDNDGLCDLVVGAPHYKRFNYNEGRIYIFYGSETGSLQVIESSETITGSGIGGQFGISLAYLGDLDHDGYGDIAVGASNEDGGAGVIYVYRGSANGLITQPSQTIRGRELYRGLRGFGISFSKLTDIDNNGYGDLAVGSYKSGHAVLLRSRPVINLLQSVTAVGRRLNVDQSTLDVCLWYTGDSQSATINVTRTMTVDDSLRRLIFVNPEDAVRTEVVTRDQVNCKPVVVRFKPNSNLYLPVTVRISQSLLQPDTPNQPYLVDSGDDSDNFCKTCPVAKEDSAYEISLPVELGCGEDQLCQSDLALQTKFGANIENGTYIIGSDDYIQIETVLENLGEKAYITELSIELPKHVQLKFVPTICTERTSSHIACSIGNPIQENQTVSLPLLLNMKAINIDRRGESIKFNVSVSTTSLNLSPVKWIELDLLLVSEGDIHVTGKSSKQIYSYGNISTGNSTFSQIYQVEKVGRSTVDKVFFDLYIPTSIPSPEGKDLTFISLYPVSGILAGRPFTCENLTQVRYVSAPNSGDVDEDLSNLESDNEEKQPVRRKRQIEILQSEEGLAREQDVGAGNGKQEASFLLNCDRASCSRIRCAIGPFNARQSVAFVKIKAVLDASVLQAFANERTKFILTSMANVTLENFEQSGKLDDSAEITTVFHGEMPESHVDIWIIIVSAIVAILILLLLILGLVKAGFFKRKQKMELEALKKQEVVEEFEKNAKLSSSEYPEDEVSEQEMQILEDEEDTQQPEAKAEDTQEAEEKPSVLE